MKSFPASSFLWTASGNRPLLIPGKKTLFQRVVLGPGAALFDAPAQGPFEA